MSGPASPRGGDPHFREAMRTLKKLLPPVGAGKAKTRLESPVEPISPSERARQAQLAGEEGRGYQADQAEARAKAEAQAQLPAPPAPAIGSGGALDGRSLSTRQRRLVKHVEELLEEALAQSAQGFAVEIKEVSVSRDSRQILVWWQYDPDAMDGARRGGFIGGGAEGSAVTGDREEATVLIPSASSSPFDPAHDEPVKASTGAWVRPPEATEEEKLMGMWLELLEPKLRRDLASRSVDSHHPRHPATSPPCRLNSVRLKYTPRVVFRLDLASAHADYVGSVLDMTNPDHPAS